MKHAAMPALAAILALTAGCASSTTTLPAPSSLLATSTTTLPNDSFVPSTTADELAECDYWDINWVSPSAQRINEVGNRQLSSGSAGTSSAPASPLPVYNRIAEPGDLDALLELGKPHCLTRLEIANWEPQQWPDQLVSLLDSVLAHGQLTGLILEGDHSAATLLERTGHEKALRQLTTLTIANDTTLVSLPDSISQLDSLNALNISNNSNLASLPNSTGRLANIEYLFINGNPTLVSLPDSIGDLKNLEVLEIFNNVSLVNLPDSIGNLTNLRYMNIGGNPSLVSLPDNIGSLESLRELSIAGNSGLVSLPDNIGSLESLERLSIVDSLSLVSLPDNLGGLASLRRLEISGNAGLKSLPDTLSRLENLWDLDIFDNAMLLALPESLENLNLSDFDLRGNGFGLEALPEKFQELCENALPLYTNGTVHYEYDCPPASDN